MNSKSPRRAFAILAYCTLIGWVISIIRVFSLEGEERKFTAFHLRQMLILMLVGTAVSIIDTVFFFIPYWGMVVVDILAFAVFICWLLGLISAIRGVRTTVPVVGRAGERMLGDMFE